MATYKKRPGTSGIRGQLYETKLISLILFRAKLNDDIKHIQLATNVDEIGAFDDICFKTELKDFDRPVVVFIQAKHRENDKSLTLQSETDLAKYFYSYLKIKRAFKPGNETVFLDGIFEETECIFVIYTTAKGDPNNNLVESSFVNNLHDLIGTGDVGSQPSYKTEDVDFLCKIVFKDEMTNLAVQMAKFLYEDVDISAMLNDEFNVQRYHVILAQKAMDISEIQPEGHRTVTFREDFFNTTEELILVFKTKFFMEILKKRKVNENETTSWDQAIFQQMSDPKVLSRLIGSVIIYNQKGKLEFVNKQTSNELKQELYKVNVSQETVDRAVEMAAREILTSRPFKVPAAFGNKDLTLSSNDKKMARRLKHLTTKILELFEKSKPHNIVTIDDSLEDGLLNINGGIAGAVGNLLVSDEDTKLMKFTDRPEHLGTRAKKLFESLKNVADNLDQYRFDVKVKTFAKLSFDYTENERSLAKDFLSKLVFYTNQADEHDVEETLKTEIEAYRRREVNNFQVISDAIFLNYHDKIQKWWMSPLTAEYLTRDCDFYESTVRNIINNPLMSVVNFIYKNKIKHFDYTFREDTVRSLELQDQLSRTIIVAENTALTVAKVKQYFVNIDHVVLDLEYILNLPRNDCEAICDELKNTSEEKLLMLVCDSVPNSRNWSRILNDIVKSVRDKKAIIITNQMVLVTIKKYFPHADNVVHDSRSNLIDMSEESQTRILQSARVIFQGEEVILELIVNDASKELVEGEVLNRVISTQKNVVGKPVGSSKYDEIKHLYLDRRVTRNKLETYDLWKPWRTSDNKVIGTLNDIIDDVVLITAQPGMGKSTLLTHLSLKTKALNPRVWIVRINLLEYAKEFSKWQENKTVIDTLESLKFMCKIILSEKHDKANEVAITLEESNGDVILSGCASDQWTVFEVKLFLHYFNKEEVVFLFDGFDEICPHYADEVITLLNTVRSYPRKHKMWIASRSYNKIKSILQKEFGKPYELELFSYKEQEEYLEKFWKCNLILTEFDSAQLDNVYEFVAHMLENQDTQRNEYLAVKKLSNLPLHVIYINALNYLNKEIVPTFKYKNVMDPVIKWRMVVQDSLDFDVVSDMFDFVGTPLHLFLMADYFQNEIKDVNKTTNKWNLDINTFTIYERFLETKLKKIRFQDKNKMDIYNPDILNTYDEVRQNFFTKHKKLAAYAIFHENNHKIFDKNELKEIKEMVEIMKNGEEKTGIIYSVSSNNVPIFVHMTFAEYFAVEHICDLLKNEKSDDKMESILDFILNVIFFESPVNVLTILDTKIKIDKELNNVLEQNGKVIFNLLKAQSDKSDEFEDIFDSENDNFKSSVTQALTENASNFLCLFLSILKRNVNKDNLNNFIKIVCNTGMLYNAIERKNNEVIVLIFDIVREFDESLINPIVGSLITYISRPRFSIASRASTSHYNPSLMKYNEMSNEELLKYLYQRAARFRRRPSARPTRFGQGHFSDDSNTVLTTHNPKRIFFDELFGRLLFELFLTI